MGCPVKPFSDMLPSSWRSYANHRTLTPSLNPSMAHIPYVPYDEAEGLLAELYGRFRDSDGMLDNIIRIHSLNPRSMMDHIELYSHLMRGPSPLSRIQREMVAVTVSGVNGCFY